MTDNGLLRKIGKLGIGAILVNTLLNVTPAMAQDLTEAVQSLPDTSKYTQQVDDVGTSRWAAAFETESSNFLDGDDPTALDQQKRGIATDILSLFGEDTENLQGMNTNQLVGKAFAVTMLNADFTDMESVRIAVTEGSSPAEVQAAYESATALAAEAGLDLSLADLTDTATENGGFFMEHTAFSVDGIQVASAISINGEQTVTFSSMDLGVDKLQALSSLANDVKTNGPDGRKLQHRP